jgi:hypothetical protein
MLVIERDLTPFTFRGKGWGRGLFAHLAPLRPLRETKQQTTNNKQQTINKNLS